MFSLPSRSLPNAIVVPLGEKAGWKSAAKLQLVRLVEWVGGDYTNVVGLPLALTVRMLKDFGIRWY